MNLTSKPLAFLLFLVLFGGIALSSALGWWQTESTKVPVTFSEGEFAGQANPADIRGSYTFGDIANAFDVTPEILAQAFQVQTDNPAAFAVKNLETMYLESGYEIGTSSVRLFVAYYLGLPFETAGLEIYLPQSAAEILLAQSRLNAEQSAYVESHTVDVAPATNPDGEVLPAPEVEPAPQAESTPTPSALIKGKTTFGELLGWGVPQENIETILGAPLPNPATTLKDYASANGLDFETMKAQLQEEVEKAAK
ncbi:MAG: hypothetical protein Fur002_15000 [Anaerolineales bacterium]